MCVGILGCGNIGKEVVCLLWPFGFWIIVYDICDYGDFYMEYDVRLVSLDVLLADFDILIFHVLLDVFMIWILNVDRLVWF